MSRKQRGGASVFFVLIILVLLVIGGWLLRERGRLTKELHASVSEVAELKNQLRMETNARVQVSNDLASLQRALTGQQAALREYMDKVHVIHSAELDLLVEGVRDGAGERQSTPLIWVDLQSADGRVVRFMSNMENPMEVEEDGTAVRARFHLHPARAPEVEGRPVADLGAMTRLRAPMQAILSGSGILVTPDSTKQLVVRVDGMEVVNASLAPAAQDAWEYDVTAAFAGLYARYQEQLKARLNAAANAPTAPVDPSR